MIISTWGSDGHYDLNRFQMKTLTPSYGIYAVLCEKGRAFLTLQSTSMDNDLNTRLYERVK